MEVDVLEETRAKAELELEALKLLFKQRPELKTDKTYRNLQRAYGHMKHGGKIIDVHAAIEKAGLNDKGRPKIAICRADATICYLTKRMGGQATYSGQQPPRYGNRVPRKCYGEIAMPEGTFEWRDNHGKAGRWAHENQRNLETAVPLIPPAILIDKVRHALKNYHLLWEVEAWDLVPPVDPMLLKRLNGTLFCVLATWDLTELERAIIKANIE